MKSNVLFAALLLAFTCVAYAQPTRLVIPDIMVVEAVVERTHELELEAGENEITLDALPLHVRQESVMLREHGDMPTVKILSLTLHRETSDSSRSIKPVWRLEAPEAGTYVFTLYYLVHQLSWNGAYSVFLAPDMSTITLQGAIAIQNTTTEQYRDAEVVLAQRSMPSVPSHQHAATRHTHGHYSPLGAGFRDEALVPLGRVEMLAANATTNLPLVNTAPIPITPFLRYEDSTHVYGPHAHAAARDGKTDGDNVWWCAEIPNTPENDLGVALPKGTVRVLQSREEGIILRTSGNLDDTPPDALLEIALAPEFGITVKRQSGTFHQPGQQQLLHNEVVVSNMLDEAHEVRLILRPTAEHRHPTHSTWEGSVTESSDPYTVRDDGRLEFLVEVAPQSQRNIVFKATP